MNSLISIKNNSAYVHAIFLNCIEISFTVKHIIPIKRLSLLSILLSFLTACSLDDPGPQMPDPIRSYFILYNYYTAPFDLEWEFEGYTLSKLHTYGETIIGYVNQDSAMQEITFSIKNPNSDTLIQSGYFAVQENNYYMVTVMGREADPYVLFEPMDLNPPEFGKIKLRFVHTSADLGPVDIYIGGSTEEYRVASGLSYRGVSSYSETTLNEISDTLMVMPQNSIPGTDTVLITYNSISIFHPDRVYLGVIGHPDPSDTSTVDLIFYNQPVEN